MDRAMSTITTKDETRICCEDWGTRLFLDSRSHRCEA
jgi:hypothetical protein